MRRGFTLFEMLLAISLVLVLTGSVFAFMWDLFERRDRLREAAREQIVGGVLMEMIESDMLGGLAGTGAVGAGVKGDATSLTLLTRGVALSLEGLSEAAGQSDEGAGGAGVDLGDLQGTEYRFDAARGTLEVRRWNGGADRAADAQFERVSDRVGHLRLRYFDGRSWRRTFDSLSAGTLPVAVEVSVWFGGPRQAPADGEIPVTTEADADGARPSGGVPMREPDRTRVIIMPDGPTAAWRAGP